jgi:G3E family GTPase
MTPIHLIAGFLGSGKTTAILHQLSVRSGERIAVLVNDVGQGRLDHERLESSSAVRVLDIPGGCLCCTAPEGFVDAVRTLLDEVRPDRIFVEPTGLALPADLLDTLRRAPYAERLVVQPVVVLVDPASLPEGEIWPPLVREQLEVADVLVANRTDLADPAAIARFDRVAAALWPAPLRVGMTSHGALDASWLEWGGPVRHRADQVGFEPHDHDHDHDEKAAVPGAVHGHRARTWSFGPAVVFDHERLVDFLAAWAAGRADVPPLVRLKGVFQTNQGVWSLQIAGTTAHEAPSSYRRGSRVDVIVRDGDPAALDALNLAWEAARSTATPADGLEVITPSGRRIWTVSDLAGVPGVVDDVGVFVPGRSGRAAPLAGLLGPFLSGGTLVAVAQDGYVSKPVPLSAVATGWVVFALGNGPLPARQGGPLRLLVPDAPDEAKACANVKALCRVVLQGL